MVFVATESGGAAGSGNLRNLEKGESNMYLKTLQWPVITLLIVGTIHFVAEMLMPDLKNMFQPPVLAPLLLAFGLWVGYRMVQSGGNYVHAILAGAILGLLPVMLDVAGFGLILGRGLQVGVLAGVFGFGMIQFGALIGGGFALSKQAA